MSCYPWDENPFNLPSRGWGTDCLKTVGLVTPTVPHRILRVCVDLVVNITPRSFRHGTRTLSIFRLAIGRCPKPSVWRISRRVSPLRCESLRNSISIERWGRQPIAQGFGLDKFPSARLRRLCPRSASIPTALNCTRTTAATNATFLS